MKIEYTYLRDKDGKIVGCMAIPTEREPFIPMDQPGSSWVQAGRRLQFPIMTIDKHEI